MNGNSFHQSIWACRSAAREYWSYFANLPVKNTGRVPVKTRQGERILTSLIFTCDKGQWAKLIHTMEMHVHGAVNGLRNDCDNHLYWYHWIDCRVDSIKIYLIFFFNFYYILKDIILCLFNRIYWNFLFLIY